MRRAAGAGAAPCSRPARGCAGEPRCAPATTSCPRDVPAECTGRGRLELAWLRRESPGGLPGRPAPSPRTRL
eukprot:6706744-Pyramimonas_sp.AAC.1